MLEYVLGVDGGASKTVALLATRDGHVVARAQVGGSNKQVAGVAATLATLDAAVAAVFAEAQLPPGMLAAACLGLSGVDRAEDLALISGWAHERRLAATLDIANDARLVIAAGTPAGVGVGLICGTGSIAFGATPDGREARAGGWGFALGDEGSGFDIARMALRAATAAADGRGPATLLLDVLLEHWELSQASDLIPLVYHQYEPRRFMVEIPPLVKRCADAGDPLACDVLRCAGAELAQAVLAVARALGLGDGAPLALAGSVIRHTPQLQHALVAALRQQGFLAEPVQLVDEPARGAVNVACRAARRWATAPRQ
jgi:N-acetylglucosamine kinase-like BadF-type ATPase